MKNIAHIRNTLLYITCALVLILIIAAGFTDTMALYYIAVGLVALFIVLELIFYRCPHCKRPMPHRIGSVEYCPYCGKHMSIKK